MNSKLKSCIYRGSIFHKRFTPTEHSFNYNLDYIFLNLDETNEVFTQSVLWSNERTNLVSFRRQDHLPSDKDLKSEVLHQIHSISGEQFNGPVYMLATLRSLGYSMNPITIFYCYDHSDALRHILVEVQNTPWNERHCYLISGPNFDTETNKAFHVSPFMPMDTHYEWGLEVPKQSLNVSIKVSRNSKRLFQAGMAFKRIEITQSNVIQLIIRHARQTFKITAGIYFHALKLWLKRVPFHTHPKKNSYQGSNK